MIFADNEIPLYQQIKELIRSAIVNEELRSGDKIPSEAELTERYKVSRVTIRSAISELVKDKYLIKKQGKGTFVSRPKIERKIEHLSSFTAACEANGLVAGARVILTEIVTPTEDDIERLSLEAGDKLLYIQRIRLAGKEPVMIENNYFSYRTFGTIAGENLQGSLFELLKLHFDIVPSDNTLDAEGVPQTSIEIARAAENQAQLLEVPLGTPLFFINTVVYDQNKNPIYIGRQYIKGDRYKFTIS